MCVRSLIKSLNEAESNGYSLSIAFGISIGLPKKQTDGSMTIRLYRPPGSSLN